MKTEELLMLGGLAYFLTRPGTANAQTPTGGGGGSSDEGPQPGDAVAITTTPKKKKAGGPRAGAKKKKPTGGTTLAPSAASSSGEATARIAGMKKRAYQAAAQAWIPLLIKAGASQAEAEGLARWAGLESSGNPYAQSPIGERGLLQCTKTTGTMKGGPFAPAEWALLGAKNTSKATHAQLAIKQFRWHVKRAKVSPNAPTVDRLWYAKAHHMRPADLSRTSQRPDAVTAANLAVAMAKTPREQVRLAAANMVAWGETAPPTT